MKITPIKIEIATSEHRWKRRIKWEPIDQVEVSSKAPLHEQSLAWRIALDSLAEESLAKEFCLAKNSHAEESLAKESLAGRFTESRRRVLLD